MKFIKKTLLNSSKSSINISALSLTNELTHDPKSKHLERELQSEYQQLKSSLKNIKHLPKYQAYLESFESLLDTKSNLLNKKLENLMVSLHFSGKKKKKQIPLLEAFMDFSPIERYKFLIDLIKNAEQHQKTIEKARTQSPYNSPTKKKEQSFEQSRIKIFSQASISLNELKKMSLSYWTKVEFELNCQKRELRVSGKQSFMLYLQNYLVRLSKNEKNCFVLLCCNPEQVPSWLRKVYIHIKKEIFVEVFQGIWSEIILIQLQKMQTSFEQLYKDNQFSPTKSLAVSNTNQEQFEIDKEAYSVFLTPLAIKTYMNEKAKFTTKIKNKLKFSLYKQVQFDSPQFESIKQKLSKISFSKAFDQKNKQIYQVKGHFNIPASVVKFKFIDSLKERNKFISSWEILENEPGKYIQAISQSYDFSELFQNESISLDPKIFKFKQLSLKEQASEFGNNETSQILTLQSIKQISKTSVTNFLVVECEQKKHEKSELTVTCEFNKHLIKRKIHKLKIDTISKEKIVEITKKLIENFLKEMVLMIFTQQKIYEETRIQNEQEFFTICEAFDNDIDELDVYSSKSIQLEQEVADLQFDVEPLSPIQMEPQRYSEGTPNKMKKSNKVDSEELGQENQLSLKKTQSLNLDKHSSPQKQPFHEEEIKQGPKDPNSYLKAVFAMNPNQKSLKPNLVKKNLLADEWLRLQEGGLTCINEEKIKEQKQIIKKILVKLGETILKQKNIMHVSLPVTIFKTQSQLTTVARGLTYAPLLLQPQHYTHHGKINQIQRLKKAVVFLISNSYSQINFQKPFNPILGQTIQYWVDGCPVYYEQISHHPPVTSYYMLGRGYKIFGSMEPSLSMGINHAKVISHCIDQIEFDDGTKMNAGANKMLVNGTTFGLRTFNLDQKNYIYDQTSSMLALFSYGPTKKGLFSSSSEPSDFIKGRITKMSEHFKAFEYFKWKKSDYSLKKQWIESEISVFEGIWNKKVFFDGQEYFNFDTQLPYELVPQSNPLPSDSRYRDDLQWLIKGDLNKSQQHKQKMEEAQRYDKKLRTKNH